MAYDEHLADRVRRALAQRTDIVERSMFGGLAFMTRGHMCCGLVGDRLTVRVDPDTYDQLLDEPGAEPMDFTGRPMRGFLYVGGEGISGPKTLGRWITRALDFASSRPEKASRPKKTMSKAESKSRRRRGGTPNRSPRQAGRKNRVGSNS